MYQELHLTPGLVIMAVFYMAAGVFHFVRPGLYMRMMPPWLPAHRFLVFFSGVCELVLGAALLVPALRSWAAWGIIALLVAVFPANVHMLTGGKFRLPRPLLILRLPLQALLIYWAWLYT